MLEFSSLLYHAYLYQIGIKEVFSSCKFDFFRQIEGKVVEISKLQQVFTEKILEQVCNK